MSIPAQLPYCPLNSAGEKTRAQMAHFLSEIEKKPTGAQKTAAVAEARLFLIGAAARIGVTLV